MALLGGPQAPAFSSDCAHIFSGAAIGTRHIDFYAIFVERWGAIETMASAIFDKLSLRSEDDLRTLTKLLDESLRNYLQVINSGGTPAPSHSRGCCSTESPSQAHGDKVAPERRAALEQSVVSDNWHTRHILAGSAHNSGPIPRRAAPFRR